MWWNKKETTKLYKRIEQLYDLMEELGCDDKYSFRDTVFEKEYASNLGYRAFRISKEDRIWNCGYGYDLYYDVYYKNSDKKIIFHLEVYEHETKLKPCPIFLSSHEIDLAILEFENYINKIYEEHTLKIKELEG